MASISSVSWGVFRVRLALVRLSAVSKISLSEPSVIPSCMPNVLVARTLVCPVSKAILTRSQLRRVARERCDLATAYSIIVGRVAACCLWNLWRRISPKRAAIVWDMLSPSLCAIVRSCSLMGSSTQDATCINFRLMEWFCERGIVVFNWRVRGVAPTITGSDEATRTRPGASLSCLTSRGPFPFVVDWVC